MAEILHFNHATISSKPTRREIWRQFCDNRSIRQIHKISDHEMALLERTALLGEFHSAADLLFMLSIIRQPPPEGDRSEATEVREQ